MTEAYGHCTSKSHSQQQSDHCRYAVTCHITRGIGKKRNL